jgi:hypothetical protein
MLKAGRSQVRFPMRSLELFFSWSIPSSRTIALGSTQPRTEMSTRNIPGGKGRPAHKAGNFTAICEPTVFKMWGPRRLTTLWTSTACYRDSFAFFFFLLVRPMRQDNIKIDPSVPEGKDGSCLRPRGHCDRLYHIIQHKIILICISFHIYRQRVFQVRVTELNVI